MKRHEVRNDEGTITLMAAAATRAGVLTELVKGLFQAMKPALSGEIVERPFKKEAKAFPELIASVLDEAIALGASHGEAYADVTFALLTDKRAEGTFVGKAAKAANAVTAAGDVDAAAQKDAEGEWVVTVRLR